MTTSPTTSTLTSTTGRSIFLFNSARGIYFAKIMVVGRVEMATEKKNKTEGVKKNGLKTHL